MQNKDGRDLKHANGGASYENISYQNINVFLESFIGHYSNINYFDTCYMLHK